MVFEADDSLVADSDPEDIRRQVFESRFTFADRLDVDDPVALPEVFWSLGEKFSLLESVAKLGSKDLATALSGMR